MANNKYNNKVGRYEIEPVTLRTCDKAVVDYFSKRVAPTVEAENGRKKVKVIYASGERWKLIRDKKGLRDENGVLILPLIAVRRMNIERSRGVYGGLPQDDRYITVSNKISKKTPNLTNQLTNRKQRGLVVATKDKVVREYLTIPFPDFSVANYQVTIWAQYHSQMNSILERMFHLYDWQDMFYMPVNYDSNNKPQKGYYFVGERTGDVVSESNTENFSGEERILRYSYNFRVPIYLMTDPKDDALNYGKDTEGKNFYYKSENAVEIKVGTEIVGSVDDLEDIF